MENNYNSWISLSFNFLDTSKAILTENIKNRNTWCMMSDTNIDFNDYLEKTKWSDFNTLIPTMFVLLHGIESLKIIRNT